MKRFKSTPRVEDIRIAGAHNGSPIAINRAIISEVRADERMHAHEKQYEFYIVISGKARMHVGEEVIEMSAGDCIMVEPEEPHMIVEVLEELDYLVIRTDNIDEKVMCE